MKQVIHYAKGTGSLVNGIKENLNSVETVIKELQQQQQNINNANEQAVEYLENLTTCVESLTKYQSDLQEALSAITMGFDTTDKMFATVDKIMTVQQQNVINIHAIQTMVSQTVNKKISVANSVVNSVQSLIQKTDALQKQTEDVAKETTIYTNDFLGKNEKMRQLFVRYANDLKQIREEHKGLSEELAKSYEESIDLDVDEVINSRRSFSQNLNYIDKVIQELITSSVLNPSGISTSSYMEMLQEAKRISVDIRKAHKDFDEHNMATSLLNMLNEVRQVVGATTSDMSVNNIDGYEVIQRRQKKLQKLQDKTEDIGLLIRTMADEQIDIQSTYVQSVSDLQAVFDKAKEHLNTITNQYIDKKVKQLKENPTQGADGDYSMGLRYKKLMEQLNGVDLNALSIRYAIQNPSMLNNSEFMDNYKDYNLNTKAYQHIIKNIEDEILASAVNRADIRGINSQEKRKSFIQQEKEKIFIEELKNGALANPLISNNDSLLKASKSINKTDLQRANNKDKATATSLRQNLYQNLIQTYNNLYALSYFDPDSILLKKLKEQAKAIEEEIKDLDEASKDDNVKAFAGLFKDVTSVVGFFTLAFSLMGMGGIFSFNNWKNMVKNRADNNGKMMYQNYMLNASIDANMGMGAYDRVYNQGTNLYANSYGMIGFDAPTNMYANLVKNVGTAYGSSPHAGAKDLSYLARNLVLPAQLYGIQDNTISGFVDVYYKENKQDAQTALTAVYQAMNNAQRSNIPIEKYIKTITDVSKNLRKMGYSGTIAMDNIQYMVDQGMRLEDARDLEGQVLGALYNFGNNKSNSVYSVLSGQTGNLWTAMLMNAKTNDMNGDPVGNRQKLLGQQMMTKLEMFGSFSANPEMKRFLYLQKLQNEGFSLKNANIIASAAVEGDDEKVGKILIGIDTEEEQKTDNLINTAKEFGKELKTSANLLAEATKNKANMTVSANLISKSLGSHNQGMLDFHNAIEKAIPIFTEGYVNVIKKIGQLFKDIKNFKQNHPIISSVGGFIWQHPIISALLGGAGLLGLRQLGKKAKHMWNHYNDYDKQEKSDSKKKSNNKGGKSKGWKSKLSTPSKWLKNLKGFGTSKLSKATLPVMIGLSIFGNSSEAESEGSEVEHDDPENKSEEENALTLADMFKTGDAMLLMKNKQGKYVDIYNESGMAEYLRSEIGVAPETVVGGSIALTALIAKSKDIIQAMKNKLASINSVAPPVPNIPNPPSVNLPPELITEPSPASNGGNPPPAGGDMLENGGKTKGGWLNKAKGFLLNNKWNLALAVGLPMLNEFTSEDSDQYTASEKIQRAGVDALVYGGTSMALSKIPYVGPILALGMPFLSSTLGEAVLGYDPLAATSSYLKNMIGVGDKYDKNNQEFLDKLLKNEKLTKESFIELVESDTEDGKRLRKILKENGLDYADLNDTEKEIFKEQMEILAYGKTAAATLVARAIIAGQRAKTAFKYNGGQDGYMLTEEGLKVAKEEADKVFNTANPDWQRIADVTMYKINKYKKALDNDEDNKEFEKQKDELSSLWFYAMYKLNGNDERWQSYVLEQAIDESKNPNIGSNKTALENWEAIFIKRAENRYKDWQDVLKQEYVYMKQAEWEKEKNTKYITSNNIPPATDVDPDGKFPADAVNQAKMISAKTGIPIEYILGMFWIESAGTWEKSQEMHNYGNTRYQGSLGMYNGFGIYADNEEASEAFANHTVAFAEEDSRALLQQYAKNNNLEAFVRQLQAKGYFGNDDPNAYIRGMRAGIAIAKGSGLTGVAEGYSGGGGATLAEAHPKTIAEQHAEGWNSYYNAIGSKGAKVTGALVNGMYIDSSQGFVSIQDKIAALRKEQDLRNQASAKELYATRQRQRQFDKQVQEQANKTSTEAYKRVSEKSNEAVREQLEKTEQAIKEEEREREKRKSEEKDVAHLQIMGTLKKGKTTEQFVQAVKGLLEKLNFETKTTNVRTN